jgi:hypothetical protein
MELLKGRKPRRAERRSEEEMFRYPAHEEMWEVSYSKECEYEEREAPRSPGGTSRLPDKAA